MQKAFAVVSHRFHFPSELLQAAIIITHNFMASAAAAAAAKVQEEQDCCLSLLSFFQLKVKDRC